MNTNEFLQLYSHIGVCVCVCNQRERNSELPDLLEFSFGTQLSKKPRRYYERRRGMNFTKHYLENHTLQKKKMLLSCGSIKMKSRSHQGGESPRVFP